MTKGELATTTTVDERWTAWVAWLAGLPMSDREKGIAEAILRNIRAANDKLKGYNG